MPKLSTQYMTIMEVGGAYAHIFFELLEFLELRSLIITDIDSVEKAGGKACVVHEGITTSNACLKSWFQKGTDHSISISELLTKNDKEKINGKMRITFQRSEVPHGPCGRTFEDAFMLANEKIFSVTGSLVSEKELSAREIADKEKKSSFALKYAIRETNWVSPGYLVDGVKWLAMADLPNEDVTNTST